MLNNCSKTHSVFSSAGAERWFNVIALPISTFLFTMLSGTAGSCSSITLEGHRFPIPDPVAYVKPQLTYIISGIWLTLIN